MSGKLVSVRSTVRASGQPNDPDGVDWMIEVSLRAALTIERRFYVGFQLGPPHHYRWRRAHHFPVSNDKLSCASFDGNYFAMFNP